VPIGPAFSEAQTWFVVRFPIVRMLEFVLGIMTARLVLTGRWLRLPLWAASCLVAVGWATAMLLVHSSLWGVVAAAIIPIILFIPTIASVDLAGRRLFLEHPVMLWLGKASFSFYLVHLLVLEYVVFAFSGSITHWQPLSGWSGVGTLAVALAAALLITAGVHHLVEMPVYRKFAMKRRRTVDPGAKNGPEMAPAAAG
jgi:peptidoglycan/LPS O-acetylase OafA/YrhL